MKLVWLLPVFILCSCSVFKKDTGTLDLSAMWEETWGAGEQTNVTYKDKYLIKQNGTEISMSCPEKSYYSFSHIHLMDTNFTFQLTNSQDPNDLYIIAYNMYVEPSGNLMKGTAVTNKGVEAKIELKRLK